MNEINDKTSSPSPSQLNLPPPPDQNESRDDINRSSSSSSSILPNNDNNSDNDDVNDDDKSNHNETVESLNTKNPETNDNSDNTMDTIEPISGSNSAAMSKDSQRELAGLRCLLCMEMKSGQDELRSHLSEVHCVKSETLDHLMNLIVNSSGLISNQAIVNNRGRNEVNDKPSGTIVSGQSTSNRLHESYLITHKEHYDKKLVSDGDKNLAPNGDINNSDSRKIKVFTKENNMTDSDINTAKLSDTRHLDIQTTDNQKDITNSDRNNLAASNKISDKLGQSLEFSETMAYNMDQFNAAASSLALLGASNLGGLQQRNLSALGLPSPTDILSWSNLSAAGSPKVVAKFDENRNAIQDMSTKSSTNDRNTEGASENVDKRRQSPNTTDSDIESKPTSISGDSAHTNKTDNLIKSSQDTKTNKMLRCDPCGVSFTDINGLVGHYKTLEHARVTYLPGNANLERSSGLEGQTPPVEAGSSSKGASRNGESDSPSTRKNGNTSQNSSSPVGGMSGTSLTSSGSSRPYRCDVCKVSYTTEQQLLTHLQCVPHTTRTAKLLQQSTGSSMTKQTFHRQDSNGADQMNFVDSWLKIQNQFLQQAVSAAASGVPSNIPLPFLPGLNPGQPGYVNLALNQATEVRASSKNNGSINLSSSAESSSKFVEKENGMEKNISKFSGKGADKKMDEVASKLGSEVATTVRKPEIFGRLSQGTLLRCLENVGFECVMQYNENCENDLLTRKPKEGLSASGEDVVKNNDVVAQTDDIKEEKTEVKMEVDTSEGPKDDLPELKKSSCGTCGKQFSSVWVLKAHEEEVHKSVVSLSLVEKFADDFRNNYLTKPDPKKALQQKIAESTGTAKTVEGVVPKLPPPTPPVVKTEPASTSLASGSRPSSTLSSHIPTLQQQQQAAQLMQLPMLMSMGLIPPAMMPMMLPGQMPTEMYQNVVQPFPAFDPMMLGMLQQQLTQQAKPPQQQQQQPAMIPSKQQPPAQLPASQVKSARTRINEEQLSVLRAHFDINNSPGEEQILDMSKRTGLPPKVIKHWFRNTLFKERQRNKDSPYNFSIPPSTTLNMADYEKNAKLPSASVLAQPSGVIGITTDSSNTNNNSNSNNLSGAGEVGMESGAARESCSNDSDSRGSADDVGIIENHNKVDADADNEQETKSSTKGEFGVEQIRELREYFSGNSYPNETELNELSQRLGLNKKMVGAWFKNARQNMKKNLDRKDLVSGQDKLKLSDCVTVGDIVDSTVKSEMKMDLERSDSPPKLVINESPGKTPGENPACKLVLSEATRKLIALESSMKAAGYKPSFTLSSPVSFDQKPDMFKDQFGGAMSESGSSVSGTVYDLGSDESGNESRKGRTNISPEQLHVLYERFNANSFPNSVELDAISKEVNLNKYVVQIWFQNTRARERKRQQSQDSQKSSMRQCHLCSETFSSKSLLKSHQTVVHADVCLGQFKQESSNKTPTLQPKIQQALPTPPINTAQIMAALQSAGLSGLANPMGVDLQQYMETLKQYMQSFGALGLNQTNQLKLPQPNTATSEKNTSGLPAALGSSTTPSSEVDDAPLDLSMSSKGTPGSSGFSFNMLRAPSVSSRHQMGEDSYSDGGDSMMGMQESPYGQGNKRYRTQMSDLQLQVMRTIFVDSKMPTISECEALGQELGLPRRVVQVWFQNARAKEKKGIDFCRKSLGSSGPLSVTTADRCALCGIKYNPKHNQQDHLFTKMHIARVKSFYMSQDMYSSSASSTSSAQDNYNAFSQSSLDNTDTRNTGTVTSGYTGASPPKRRRTVKPSESTTSTSAPQMTKPGLPAVPGGPGAQISDLLGGMMNYLYSGGLGGMNGFMPLSNDQLMSQSLLSGMMYDPASFGVQLNLLQIPAEAIRQVEDKVKDSKCLLTQYSQDMLAFSDLKKALAPDDWAVSVRATLDVGFICKKCSLVFPRKESCIAHLAMRCYGGMRPQEMYKVILKLEQMLYKCSLCTMQFNTIAEFCKHCSNQKHIDALKAWKSKSADATKKDVDSACESDQNEVKISAVAADSESSNASNSAESQNPELAISKQDEGSNMDNNIDLDQGESVNSNQSEGSCSENEEENGMNEFEKAAAAIRELNGLSDHATNSGFSALSGMPSVFSKLVDSNSEMNKTSVVSAGMGKEVKENTSISDFSSSNNQNCSGSDISSKCPTTLENLQQRSSEKEANNKETVMDLENDDDDDDDDDNRLMINHKSEQNNEEIVNENNNLILQGKISNINNPISSD